MRERDSQPVNKQSEYFIKKLDLVLFTIKKEICFSNGQKFGSVPMKNLP